MPAISSARRLFVKLLRVWLVVLLAVVLPVKGALAAALCCPPSVLPVQAGVMAQGAEHHHGDMAPGAGAHDPAQHHPGPHDHGKGTQGKCNFCSSSCSSPSLPSASLGLGEPEGLASQSFPDLSAPAPTFLSDGQERPPRSR